MVRKICLDSDSIINISRGDISIKEKLNVGEAILFTTSVNYFEIWLGKKQDSIEGLLSSFEILPFDDNSAEVAADIFNELKKTGQIIDVKDLFIASICIANKVDLLTFNKKHFERLEKFGLILV